jgi:type II secretory pathway pseudopilin PulG
MTRPWLPAARPSHLGFSLIELLVVIATIALLLGLILPALGKARESGRTVKCQAGMKQVGAAIHLYANQNKDRMVPPNWTVPNSTAAGWLYAPPAPTAANAVWSTDMRRTGLLWQFLENDAPYRCPSHKDPFVGAAGITSYLFNGALSGFAATPAAIKTYTVDRFKPDDILVWDSGADDWNDGAGTPAMMTNERHGKGVPVLCADARVEVIPSSTMSSLSADGPNRAWCSPDLTKGGMDAAKVAAKAPKQPKKPKPPKVKKPKK